jgi:hypothetical protein
MGCHVDEGILEDQLVRGSTLLQSGVIDVRVLIDIFIELKFIILFTPLIGGTQLL